MTGAVVLNYRTADRTIAAVHALELSIPPPAPIIVVDNASGDGSLDRLRAALTGTSLISADTNGGFSAGCNLGIREALLRGAERILLLNGDVVVATDMIERLEKAMDDDPSCGIAGPVLLSASQGERIESTGIRYSPAFGRIRHDDFDRSERSAPRFETKRIDAVTGCAMLVSRQVFGRVGMLAEEFFFGFEDLDFCIRARREGFTVVCVGTARAWHEGSASIGRHSPARAYFATRNQLLLASRTPMGSLGSALRMMSVVTLNAAHAVTQSDVPRVRALRAMMRGIADHARRRYGPAPADL